MIPPPNIEETLLKSYDPRVASRLAGLFKPYAFQVFISLLLMLLNSTAAVAGPYLVKIAIDSGMEAGSREVLGRTALLYLAAIAIQWLSIFIRVNIMVRVGQSIIFNLRADLFAHIQSLSLSFFARFSAGRVITRLINDVTILREFITWALLAVARDLFTVIGILVAMFVLNTRLALITAMVLPFMIGLTILFRRRARENYRRVRAAISWVNSVLAENINGVRVVQAFSRQKTNYDFFHDYVNRNNLDSNLKASQLAAAFPAGIDLIRALAISLVVAIGGILVLNLDPNLAITPGILIAFVLYIERLFDPIQDLSQRYDSFQATMAGGERVLSLLDTPPEVQDDDNAIALPPIQGWVEFRRVSFHYSDDASLVLENISFRVQPGETIALVGRTGAGKTTIVRLVSRFYDPTSGAVLIDGHDLRQVTQHSLRSQMGIVMQDPFLFSGSVMENIRFGKLDASDGQVIEAAKAVGVHEFIMKLPHGYHSQVEEGGVLLSVGQRQLISFARALLADPRVLILDEATSSIDMQTEVLIQRALVRILHDRTSFVIAHRLSTIVAADQILVIEDGRIREGGAHSELMAKKGIYYSLYQKGFSVD